MKIGIVMHPYGEQKPSGLGRTTPEITRAIIEGDTDGNEYVVFVKGHHAKRPEFNGRYTVVECRPGFLWLDRALRSRQDLDIVFFITPFMPLFVRLRSSVVMVHDLVHFRENKIGIRIAAVRFVHRRSIKRASVITAISPGTRNDLINILNVPQEKIVVVRQGYTRICEFPEEYVPGIKEPFFLSVGVIKERKNTLRIVEAFSIFKKNNQGDHQLVVAGPYAQDEYFQKIKATIRRYDIEKSVVFIGFANDYQLSYLYSRTVALIFTTLFEGFGAPILEAMHCGSPVITSDLSVHRETAGKAGYIADPKNPAAIAETMKKVVSDDLERQRRIQQGRVHAKDSSWEKAAEKYRSIFKKLAHESISI